MKRLFLILFAVALMGCGEKENKFGADWSFDEIQKTPIGHVNLVKFTTIEHGGIFGGSECITEVHCDSMVVLIKKFWSLPQNRDAYLIKYPNGNTWLSIDGSAQRWRAETL